MIIVSANMTNNAQVQSTLKKLGSYAEKTLNESYWRAAEGMKTDGTRLVVKESSLKRPYVFNSFRVIKAKGQARVLIKGQSTQLYLYGANPNSPMTGITRGGVRVKISGERQRFKHAFVAKFKSGHVGIFERQKGIKTKNNKTQLKELFTTSVPQYADRPHIKDLVLSNADERFMKRFEQQTKRFLKKMGAK